MTPKQTDGSFKEAEERSCALVTNADAVRAVCGAVEGTIGPKGLDTMLIDREGEVLITNDGITILERMEANHPAAKLLIHIAKAQQEEAGDGTTTATLIAGELVSLGARQVLLGVPVTKVIEGIRLGVAEALRVIEANTRPVENMDDINLRGIAMVAGREHEDIAELVIESAKLIGKEKLCQPRFKLSETIVAEENAENEVFMGVMIAKERMNKDMPESLMEVKVLVFDDALESEAITKEALGTESGFLQYMRLETEFKENLRKIIAMGVGLVLVDRGVSPAAEEMLTDAGVMVYQRVEHEQLERAAAHVGARLMKRTGIKKAVEDMEKCAGYASHVYEDEKLRQLRILGGGGKPMATVLVGAATEEVVGERKRIAADAASGVQAAIRGGFVSGGGSVELAAAAAVADLRDTVRGMAAYGMDCVVGALKRPLSQIVKNAGYNPLEKVEEAMRAQAARKLSTIGVDCDSGKVIDMAAAGIVDPAFVKYHAIKAGGEVAVSILRIDKIIRKQTERGGKNAVCDT